MLLAACRQVLSVDVTMLYWGLYLRFCLRGSRPYICVLRFQVIAQSFSIPIVLPVAFAKSCHSPTSSTLAFKHLLLSCRETHIRHQTLIPRSGLGMTALSISSHGPTTYLARDQLRLLIHFNHLQDLRASPVTALPVFQSRPLRLQEIRTTAPTGVGMVAVPLLPWARLAAAHRCAHIVGSPLSRIQTTDMPKDQPVFSVVAVIAQWPVHSSPINPPIVEPPALLHPLRRVDGHTVLRLHFTVGRPAPSSQVRTRTGTGVHLPLIDLQARLRR